MSGKKVPGGVNQLMDNFCAFLYSGAVAWNNIMKCTNQPGEVVNQIFVWTKGIRKELFWKSFLYSPCNTHSEILRSTFSFEKDFFGGFTQAIVFKVKERIRGGGGKKVPCPPCTSNFLISSEQQGPMCPIPPPLPIVF